MATRPFFRKSNSAAAPRKGVRNVMCGTVMEHACSLLATDSMASVLDVLTKHDWDHVFIVDGDGAHGSNPCRRPAQDGCKRP